MPSVRGGKFTLGFTIAVRIGLLNATGVLGLVLIGAICMIGQTLAQPLQNRLDAGLTASNAVASAMGALTEARRWEAKFALDQKEADLSRHLLALGEAKAHLYEAEVRAGLPSLLKFAVGGLRRQLQEYQPVTAIRFGTDGAAMAPIFASAGLPEQFVAVQQAAAAEVASTQARLVEKRNRLQTFTQLSIGCIILMVSCTAWAIGRGIAAPLTQVAQQTDRIAKGDRTIDIGHTSRSDEIGDMARALAVFRETMDRNIQVSTEIHNLAHFDPLTGLANRTLLQDKLREALARSGRDGYGFAVHCLDLDGFKAVNDLYGHAAGDAVLKAAAQRIISTLRENDTPARRGGDEFIVIQDGIPDPASAHALAERLMRSLSTPYTIDGGIIQGMLTASIGVAMFPADGIDPDTLLRNAGTALHRAKTAGRNRVAFFMAEMDRDLRNKRRLERDVGDALRRGEFALAWQPLAEAEGGNAITGFEVLLRWSSPARGNVSPVDFIPVAEATGAIIGIGEWVLQEACRRAMEWPQPLGVAVNVSPVQVQQGPDFAAIVERVLRTTGLPAHRLTLEVTEGVLIQDVERVLTALRSVKAMGVRVALDDFGTGYSSLATLQAFPFDKLKIDRSFIAGIAAGGQDAAIVRAVLGLAKGLGLPVVAEGVETEAQLSVLQQIGCEEVQGWLIGRPAPVAAFKPRVHVLVGGT